MGRIFLHHPGGARLYSCANCDTALTNRSQLTSMVSYNSYRTKKYRIEFFRLFCFTRLNDVDLQDRSPKTLCREWRKQATSLFCLNSLNLNFEVKLIKMPGIALSYMYFLWCSEEWYFIGCLATNIVISHLLVYTLY